MTRDPSLASAISTTIQRCLLDACGDDTEGDCSTNANAWYQPGGFRDHYSLNLTGGEFVGINTDSDPGYFNSCRFIDAPATADVAGIGVGNNAQYVLSVMRQTLFRCSSRTLCS